MATDNSAHTKRIRDELIAAGVTGYGLKKSESRYLPRIIHEDEHIGGVVYGRYVNGSAMLIATNLRVIFLDRKPLFTTNEEVTYDVVSGFKIDLRGVINVVTLHTRIGDFTLKYVNHKCAIKFKHFLESRHLEGYEGGRTAATVNEPASPVSDKPAAKSFPFITDEALKFLRTHETAVFSTASKTGAVHGAVVYYLIDEQHRIYLLTKSETRKAKNILENKKVAFTAYDADKAQTLQIQGVATVESDQTIRNYVFNQIMKPHKYNGTPDLPPVAWLEAGMFVIIKITPKSCDFSDFSKH